MDDVPKFYLPKPYVFLAPTQDELEVKQAHLDGRLTYEASDGFRFKMRVVENDKSDE